MLQMLGVRRAIALRGAVTKLRENLRTGSDAQLLSKTEKTFLLAKSCLGTSLTISPSRLDRQLVAEAADDREFLSEVIGRNVIFMRRMRDRRVTSRATNQFLREIIDEKKSYQETSLYRAFVAGEPLKRYVQTAASIEKIQMNSPEDFASYYDKCIRLADSIRRHGIIDVTDPDRYMELPPELRKKDSNIGVAIDYTGKVLLYKSGQHRLALAQILHLDRVPVRVRAISGEYLKTFIENLDGLKGETLFAAIKAATDHIRLCLALVWVMPLI
jgi:hypothetical protein